MEGEGRGGSVCVGGGEGRWGEGERGDEWKKGVVSEKKKEWRVKKGRVEGGKKRGSGEWKEKGEW